MFAKYIPNAAYTKNYTTITITIFPVGGILKSSPPTFELVTEVLNNWLLNSSAIVYFDPIYLSNIRNLVEAQ